MRAGSDNWITRNRYTLEELEAVVRDTLGSPTLTLPPPTSLKEEYNAITPYYKCQEVDSSCHPISPRKVAPYHQLIDRLRGTVRVSKRISPTRAALVRECYDTYRASLPVNLRPALDGYNTHQGLYTIESTLL